MHKDWAPHFSDEYALIEEIAKHLGIKFSQVTVRAHPQWKRYGLDLDKFHRRQCLKFGFEFISAFENIDTSAVIQNASFVVVNGSSTAFEAGYSGKTVINISPTFYDNAEFCYHLMDVNDIRTIKQLNHVKVVKRSLQTWYNLNFQRMSLTDNIIPQSGYDYRYKPIEHVRLLELFFGQNMYQNVVEDFSVYNEFDKNRQYHQITRKLGFLLWEVIDRCTR